MGSLQNISAPISQEWTRRNLRKIDLLSVDQSIAHFAKSPTLGALMSCRVSTFQAESRTLRVALLVPFVEVATHHLLTGHSALKF